MHVCLYACLHACTHAKNKTQSGVYRYIWETDIIVFRNAYILLYILTRAVSTAAPAPSPMCFDTSLSRFP